jgi:hypothetical protein
MVNRNHTHYKGRLTKNNGGGGLKLLITGVSKNIRENKDGDKNSI